MATSRFRATGFFLIAQFTILLLCARVSEAEKASDVLMSALRSRSDLSEFLNALSRSRIDKVLSDAVDSGKVTVFAASNAAFSSQEPGVISCLFSSQGSIDILTQVMLYHIAVGNNYTFQELKSVSELTAASGLKLDIEYDSVNEVVWVGQSAYVTVPDAISTVNATVHVIENVLFPQTIESTFRSECSEDTPFPGSESAPEPLLGAVIH